MNKVMNGKPQASVSEMNVESTRRLVASSRHRSGSIMGPQTALGTIVSEAVENQLLTVRGAAKRVGMSPSQLSKVMRGLYGVRASHLANLVVGLNLSASEVMSAIYDENRRTQTEPAT